MREITFAQALNEALREEMAADPTVVVWGEDIIPSGVFGVTTGLCEAFGSDRVRNTPIAEVAVVGLSVGAAVTGLRPVPEIMFSDFLGSAMDQIINQMAKIRYMFGGQACCPVTLRTSSGAGVSAGAQHSQSLHGLFVNIPGLKIALPSTPRDAKGLLKAAIRDNNPVMFFEHKKLYDKKGVVPKEDYIIPLGQADVKRTGTDVTIVATQWMVEKSLEAAVILEKDGISVEVVDPRTLVPMDRETIINSVKKTHRLIVADESPITGGTHGEIVSIVIEEAFDYLDAPIKRVGPPDAPYPVSPILERKLLPGPEEIVEAVRSL